MRRLGPLLVCPGFISLVLACGSDGNGTASTPNGTTPPTSSSTPAPSTSASAPDASPDALPADPIVGLWDVSGKDARGDYAGQVEVQSDAGGYNFIRTVHYAGLTVENGRELHWLFRGKLTKNGDAVALTSSLRRLDFISKRGSVTRTSADAPIPLTGALTLSAAGEVTGTITGDGYSLADTWRARKPLPSTPIFEDKRTLVPAHAAPSATEKQTQFALYADYHKLDIVKPYVNRSEFNAAIHGHWYDRTDLEFYRANPNALRVVDKVIDDVSLGETLVRADAYRYTLVEKAQHYDADIENRFIDPDIGMIPSGSAPGGGYADQQESGDGSLWTGIYLAGEVFRFEVTGEAKAKENVVRSLDALLKLQEITGDWAHFARTLRKPKGNPQPPWHAGTGPYAGYEWLEGGNNDMVKGLFYGYLMGWELLCEGGKTGYESYCQRIATNAKHLADDVQLGGSNAPASALTNKLPANWLAAVVATNVSDATSYRATAEGVWAVAKLAIPSTAVFYSQGIVDWSGAHLTSVGDMIDMFLAKRMDLGGDAEKLTRDHIDASQKNLEKQRFPQWHLLKAAFGTGAGASNPFIKDAVSRFEEAQYPKVSHNVDRTIMPEFCMSPYPSAPWKGDWMNYPQADRTQGLNDYPLFEMHPDVLYWKIGNDYRSWEGYEAPGGDYLHLYWFARKYGLIGATD
jgi:hypothetical protein